jgi:DNA-binding transcriptional regulator YiaG
MRRKHSKLGREIIRDLTALAESLESERGIPGQFTVRVVESIPAPGRYNARQLRATRAKLQVSQSVMAQVLGVSTKLVQAWEQESREPSGPVRRLLDEINRRPADWAAMIRPKAPRKQSA